MPEMQLMKIKNRKDKNKKYHKNNKGVMTVEISLIMPIVIAVVFITIYAFIFLLDSERVRSEIYSAIYTVSIEEKDAAQISSYDIQNKIDGALIWQEAQIKNLYIDGQLIEMGKLSENKSGVVGKTEINLCTDRLRRWQLYGNIAEK